MKEEGTEEEDKSGTSCSLGHSQACRYSHQRNAQHAPGPQVVGEEASLKLPRDHASGSKYKLAFRHGPTDSNFTPLTLPLV